MLGGMTFSLCPVSHSHNSQSWVSKAYQVWKRVDSMSSHLKKDVVGWLGCPEEVPVPFTLLNWKLSYDRQDLAGELELAGDQIKGKR